MSALANPFTKKWPQYNEVVVESTCGKSKRRQTYEQTHAGAAPRACNQKRRERRRLMEQHGVITGRGWRKLKKWLRANKKLRSAA